MKLLQDYTIVIRPDDNGTFVAYVPAIPGCHAWGETLDEARAEIVNVFEMIKEGHTQTKTPQFLESKGKERN
jgi:predicted RNase H-like HicB family nuclease